ncbi:hypothetical protein FRC12_017917 [Ceratobasidium sp. 428]|nr:hypothetical protein FRC12_017917 [Ceratobasidium sp. 428]
MTQDAPDDPMTMPGAICVKLKGQHIITHSHFISTNNQFHSDHSYSRAHTHDLLDHILYLRYPAGDTVFYQNNILHTAAYHPEIKRATLHANFGDIRGGNRRARMILQHKVDWVRDDAFVATFQNPEAGTSPNPAKMDVEMNHQAEDEVASRLKGMRDRLLAMADSVDVEQIGYSQQG